MSCGRGCAVKARDAEEISTGHLDAAGFGSEI
jgi:hypothetical protein